MYSFAPVGPLSPAAVLRRDRPEVSCELYGLNRRVLSGALPLGGTFRAAAAEDICPASPDVVGFMTECDSCRDVPRVAEEVERAAPGCGVVPGGPHASALARSTLELWQSVDAVVIGEGEAAFPELLDAPGAGRAVPGAVARDECGRLLRGGARPLVELVRDMYGATRLRLTHDPFTTVRRRVRAVCEELTRAGPGGTRAASRRSKTRALTRGPWRRASTAGPGRPWPSSIDEDAGGTAASTFHTSP